jgi:hypothetical protein
MLSTVLSEVTGQQLETMLLFDLQQESTELIEQIDALLEERSDFIGKGLMLEQINLDLSNKIIA